MLMQRDRVASPLETKVKAFSKGVDHRYYQMVDSNIKWPIKEIENATR